jgi:hypothetical protein
MRRFFVLLSFLMLGTNSIKAQEENVIAIAIYNFTRYIDWPADQAGKDFLIDVIGHKSVCDKLKEITTGRKVGNRNIIVRYLETPDKITTSEILFVGFWQSKDMPKILDKLKAANTLLITEKDGQIESGSAINFVIRNNTIKFEVKKSNIVKYGLALSETLEQMAFKAY